ncbi:MAG: DUF192 domain-containing protein [Chloroflexota bacterium]|nr:DUF192 domain-containing protein [Chloroflexota bacterium]
MKAFLSLLSALACAALLYGCGGEALSPQPETTSAPVATSATGAASQPTSAPTPAASTPSPSGWVPPTALVGTPIPGAEATLTAAPMLNRDTLVITNSKGESVSMTVEIADTEASRELGLMFRSSMPPDAGMLFDFNGDTQSAFWMQNTILPLSIAFIKADGTIVDVKDMQPLDITPVEASAPYRYALEANQGFFKAHNIAPGDMVTLPGSTGAIIPGMPDCDNERH